MAGNSTSRQGKAQRSLNNYTTLKCHDCACGIETDEGVWCIRLKRVPERETVKKCKRFLPKNRIRR